MRGDKKTIGIMGGMGPAATVAVMERIIRRTPAQDDHDHFRLLVDSDPQVPSRIAALIEKRGTDPLPALAAMAKGLEAAGANFLIMACNTAHHYHEAIAQAVRIPFISMIEVAAEFLREHHTQACRIGLLASQAVYLTRVYEKVFEEAGLTIVVPGQEKQEALLTVIRNVKAGHTGEAQAMALHDVGVSLTRNSDAILVACTELSILPVPRLGAIPVLDTLDLLADAAIGAARGTREAQAIVT